MAAVAAVVAIAIAVVIAVAVVLDDCGSNTSCIFINRLKTSGLARYWWCIQWYK